MPYCEDCARYFAPSAMNEDGSCPSCGRSLEAPPSPVTGKTVSVKELAGEDAKAPWHFKLLVVALVVYLVWRFADMIGLV